MRLSRERRCFRFAVGLATMVGAVCAATPSVAADPSLEYSVKGAFLSKFGLFTEWWDIAANPPARPFQLCILGEDPFGPTLDKIASEQLIKGRKIEVRRLKTVGKESGCQILYIASSESPRVAQILENLHGSGALTVTDGRPAGAPAGIINFILKDDRVRFDIDDELAAQNGMFISSTLLALAVNVKRRQSREVR